MRVIGIDEAGYGPLLGPLTVGAVSLECDSEGYDPQKLWNVIGPQWGIADSKTVLSHRNMAAGEETTLAFLSLFFPSLTFPTTRRELLRNVLISPSVLDSDMAEADAEGPDAPGPVVDGSCLHSGTSFHREACIPDETLIPRWGRAPTRERIEDLRRRLDSAGFRLAAARAIALCPGRFNRALSGGMSKLLLDWKLFAELLRLDSEALAPSGLAVCGKLGGRGRYGSLLTDLGIPSVIEEGRALSVYQVADFGRVEFIRHAEAAHLPVAMASMIAKLVREYLHDQWHTVLAQGIPGLKSCSGYRDVVTKRYVKQTEAYRERLGIPVECFIRNK